jgi:hypothetical protein
MRNGSARDRLALVSRASHPSRAPSCTYTMHNTPGRRVHMPLAVPTTCLFCAPVEGPKRRTREGEWMGVDKKFFSKKIEAPTRWTRLPTHVSDSTTNVGKDHIATGVLIVPWTNTQPSEEKLTNTHSGNLHGLLPMLHRLDWWPVPVRPVTPVRPVDRASRAGG